jgi:hypothetical protein
LARKPSLTQLVHERPLFLVEPSKAARQLSAHSGQQPAPGKSQVISLTDPAAAELLHRIRIRKNQFNLGKLPKHAQTAPAIWKAVLAA